MKNKITAFIISLIITVVSFLFIVYIEQKIFNPSGTGMVYVVKLDTLVKNYVINEENFDELFTQEERRNEQIVEKYIEKKEDAYGAILNMDMYKNEILSMNKIAYVDDELNEMFDKRELSIKASDVASVVGGVLREGDKVDLIVTVKQGDKINTERKLEDLYISSVYDANGKKISRKEKEMQALGITFTASSSKVKAIQNAISLGSWKLVKVVDDSDTPLNIPKEG
ncbi:hypothetical protein [Clostridium gasigenes]|uniref:Flp pilus assembly protein CpaB n=1 Tax=Clostridium gasigenes TaxID=94869 RepID=A0A7X0SFM4_9CLOT|nr:hypothetical protein [Clostridium gasigenes]MBB6716644.1 hypothetical protein [Clostridium gasigenes]